MHYRFAVPMGTPALTGRGKQAILCRNMHAGRSLQHVRRAAGTSTLAPQGGPGGCDADAAAVGIYQELQCMVDAAYGPGGCPERREPTTELCCGVGTTHPVARGVPHVVSAACMWYRQRLPRRQWLQVLSAFVCAIGSKRTFASGMHAHETCRHRQQRQDGEEVHAVPSCLRCSVHVSALQALQQCITQDTEVGPTPAALQIRPHQHNPLHALCSADRRTEVFEPMCPLPGSSVTPFVGCTPSLQPIPGRSGGACTRAACVVCSTTVSTFAQGPPHVALAAGAALLFAGASVVCYKGGRFVASRFLLAFSLCILEPNLPLRGLCHCCKRRQVAPPGKRTGW